jgi:hypothetical protein
LVFVHYYDKAAAAKGIDFDPDKPVVLVPHCRVGSRLLLYLGIVLPVLVYCAHRRMLKVHAVSPFSDVNLQNQRLILSLKAQHPLIPFSWWSGQEQDVCLKRTQVLANADYAYSRKFREMSLKCKRLLIVVLVNHLIDNGGQELTLSNYRHFLSNVMKKVNIGYANAHEKLRAQLVSHQPFKHSAATSRLYGQTGDGLNLVVDGELKVEILDL